MALTSNPKLMQALQAYDLLDDALTVTKCVTTGDPNSCFMASNFNLADEVEDLLKPISTNKMDLIGNELYNSALEENRLYDLALDADYKAYFELPFDLQYSVLNKLQVNTLNLEVDDYGYAYDSFFMDKYGGLMTEALNGNQISFSKLPAYMQNSVVKTINYSAFDDFNRNNISLAKEGDQQAFLKLTLDDQKQVLTYLQRNALYENWIKGYDPKNFPNLDNIEVVTPVLGPAQFRAIISIDDPGMKIVLKEVDEIAKELAVDSTKLTREDLTGALYKRNDAIAGYNDPNSPNYPWANENVKEWRDEGGAELGKYFTSDCTGNVCSQNAALLQVSFSEHGFESRYLGFEFTDQKGVVGGHGVVMSGGKIYDPTWGGFGTEEDWLKMIEKEGYTKIVYRDSIEITKPK
jgi:hypothetical protein